MPRIIIVDDDVDAVETLKAYFEEFEMPVLACGYDGNEAVELYKKYNSDVMFLDLDMPVYDGFYAIEQIKKINSQAKIVILTGTIEEKLLQKLDEYHPHAIIFKPYSISKLLSIIKE